MAATVLIRELNGPSQTATDKSSATIRYRMSDSPTVDLNNAIIVPVAQTAYSYEKFHRLYVSGGTYTQITDLAAYTDGGNGYGAGVKLWWLSSASYTQPAIPNVAQDPPQYSATPMVNAFSYTSGASLSLGAGPFDSTGLPKQIGSYLVSVMEVEVGATAGVKTAEPYTFVWSETA